MSGSGTGAYELVVFDWDGTLVDSTGAITEAIRSSAADLGLPVPSRERASHVIGLGLFDAIHYAVPTLERAQVPAFVERYRHHYMKEDERLPARRNLEAHTCGAVAQRLGAAHLEPMPSMRQRRRGNRRLRAGARAELIRQDPPPDASPCPAATRAGARPS